MFIIVSENLLQHFHSDEQPFIRKVLDWRERVLQQYVPLTTPFLNPREQFIVNSLLGKSDEYHYQFWGGHEAAENKRCVIAPAYYSIEESDYEIVPLAIHYPQKFHQLSHHQILGTLIGAGMNRERIGDIITRDGKWQFFIDQAISDFITLDMDRIGKVPVRLEEISDSAQIIQATSDWDSKEVVLISFRLDAFLSEGFKLSRAKAKQLIEAGACKRNWVEIKQANTDVHVNDIISLRGYGRLRLEDIRLKTKKEKYRVKIGVIKVK